jgi:O-antigen/teichoic acid export membrane protein
VLGIVFEHALALLGREGNLEVGIVARVLVVAALVRAVQQLFLVLLTSTGRPELTLRYSVITLVVLTVSTVIGLEAFGPASGLFTVAVCWLGTMALVLGLLVRVANELGLLRAHGSTAEGTSA